MQVSAQGGIPASIILDQHVAVSLDIFATKDKPSGGFLLGNNLCSTKVLALSAVQNSGVSSGFVVQPARHT
jgi:hypothetical protein